MKDNHTSTAPVRILVAEQPEIIAALCTVHDNGLPLTFVSVRDGVAALDKLQADTFDLAIVDLGMKRLDALRLIALIRATPEHCHLPILAIASQYEPASTLESVRAGANDYLARPIDWPLMTMRLRQLTGQRN